MFNFILKKILKSRLKNLPKEHQDKVLQAFEKNPKLFQEIAKKIQDKVKSGANQQNASLQVMMEYREQLQELMK